MNDMIWCRGMGGGVASGRCEQGGVPEICGGAAAGVRTGDVRVGVLDLEKCEQPLESGMDV